MRLVRGNELNDRQRNHVLRAYIYRWTHENEQRTHVWRCELCDIRVPYVNDHSAEGHTHPTIPLQTDEQWLAEHAFYVNTWGELSAKHRFCVPVALMNVYRP